MKKIFLLLIMLIPISVFAANTCNSDKIVIKSVTKADESGYVEENSDALTDGGEVSTDIKLYDVGDSITYNIKLKNNSDEDYSLDHVFSNSENVKYEIISDNNKLKANEEKTIQLKITYTKRVDDSMYSHGKYTENKELDMIITNRINNNPITSTINKIVIILLLIVFLLLSGLLIKRDIKYSGLLLLLLFIPIFVKADCRYVIKINSNIELKKIIPNPCTYVTEPGGTYRVDDIDEFQLFNGATYTNGQYKYTFFSQNYPVPGWRVELINNNSTEAITTKLCSSINGKPIVDMGGLFYESQAESIDLSNFDTSNVYDMSYMFYRSQATTLDLSSFDTSNVTDMGHMFEGSQARSLDLSGFDTRNVTNMSDMFCNSQATTLDLSNFDTSNVTDMIEMFYESQATSINISGINTSKVTNMRCMFTGTKATQLDLSSFDTSNVTDMGGMFDESCATTLDLSSFDTSNVTFMANMFRNSLATTINVSSFDTRKVTTMNGMFNGVKVTSLDLSSFSADSLTDMNWMFAYTIMPTIDLSSLNISSQTSKVAIFVGSSSTTVYFKTQAILSSFASYYDAGKPSTMTYLVKEN